MFPLLKIAGGPRERGRQYGAQAAPLIRHSIASYARLFALRRGLDWEASQVEAGRYLPLLADYAGDLLEELRGIAEGAGLELAELVALNVRTEILAGTGVRVIDPGAWAALERNRAHGVPQHPDTEAWQGWQPAELAPIAADDGECTTVAALPGATADGKSYLAQTWDWNGEQRTACLLLHIEEPGRPTMLTMTEAGILAKVGLNEAGLAVSLNLLRSEGDGRVPGMPVHVLLRQLLQVRTLAEAQALINQLPAGGSSCVTVAAADGQAVSFELTPQGNAAIPAGDALLAHSNHCLDGDLSHGECPLDAASTSLERLDRARLVLAGQRGQIDATTLMALLRDHDGDPRCICRHPDLRLPPFARGESVCGIVMDLDARVMYVAPDVPCQVEFTPVAVG